MSCLGIAARVPRSARSSQRGRRPARCRHPGCGAARLLAGRLGCSQRQARRYVALAATGGRVPVPDEGTVFTVRLPVRLAAAVRDHARASGRTVSAVVARPWKDFSAVLTDRPGR